MGPTSGARNDAIRGPAWEVTMVGRAVLLAWVLVVTPLAVLGATGGSSGAVTVPGCPVTQLTRSGPQTTAVNDAATDATWDLSGAVWDHVAPAPITYPVHSEQWTRGCIVGAQVLGDVPRTLTRDQWYDGRDGGPRMGGEAFRQTLTDTPGNYLLLRDTYASDYEDAYDPNGASPLATLYLDHVQAHYIRDDCIENEGSGSTQVPLNVVVRDSLFDGCFTGFAERPPKVSDGDPNGKGSQSFVVEHSLLYVQPQPLGPHYCSATLVSLGRCLTTSQPKVWLGAHGIWKWSSAAAGTVVVRNSIFRLDVPSYSACTSQVWPTGTYQDVVLVWTGAGPYASAGGCANALPPGVRLTTDVGVWDRAKAAWLAGQPWDANPPPPDTTPPGGRTGTRLSCRAVAHLVSGRLTTVAGRRLVGRALLLQRRPAGATRWTTTSRATSDSTGRVRRTVRPARVTWYRWSYRGEHRYAATRSKAVQVLP
jgi:hypothetical protein